MKPQAIVIEPGVETAPVTQRILTALPDSPPSICQDTRSWLQQELRALERYHDRPRDARLHKILIERSRGNFIKECPCCKDVLGCGYFTINTQQNCRFACTYCILQSYLNNPYMTIYANSGDLVRDLDLFLQARPNYPVRIGTGELGDSLDMDHVTGYSRFLVDYFRDKPQAYFELKTKSDNIANLIGLNHGERTVIAWSLNPDFIIPLFERGSASLEKRLAAASTCVAEGYPIAFHFDPLLQFPGWEKAYQEVLTRLFDTFAPASIKWISLGCLRFDRNMYKILQESPDGRRLLLPEFITTADGKFRYLKADRVRMFRHMANMIAAWNRSVPVYLCMERKTIWQAVLGWAPDSSEAVNQWLVTGKP
jgi:spore photoproduct lyase